MCSADGASCERAPTLPPESDKCETPASLFPADGEFGSAVALDGSSSSTSSAAARLINGDDA